MEFSTFLSSKLPDWKHGGVMCALILFVLPIAANWYYGNLSIYTDSYFIHQVGMEHHTSGSMWFVSLFMIISRVSLLLGGIMAKRIGPQPTMILSCLGFNAGIFATYFAVQFSFWAMNFSFGVFSAFFSGITLGMGLLYAALWFPKNMSVATSIVASAFAGGSMILNPLITLYINPEDKSPDVITKKSSYFSDEDILSRVPGVFLVLGGVSSAFHFVGAILLYICTRVSALDKTENSPEDASVTVKFDSAPSQPNERVRIIPSQSSNGNFGSTVGVEQTAQNLPPDLSNGNDQTDMTAPDLPKDFSNKMDETIITTGEQSKELYNKIDEPDMTTIEMLKSVLFYKTCCAIIPTVLVYNIGTNYYKQFGLLYFNDDHFFATVGVFISVTVCICRVLWGFILGAIGPQKCFILISALDCVLNAFWYFTPMVNKWLFLISTLSIQAVQTSVSLIIPLMALKFFGKTHYVINFGTVNFISSSFGLLTPVIVDTILNNFGYFWIFLLVSVCNFLSLCVAFCLPSVNHFKR